MIRCVAMVGSNEMGTNKCNGCYFILHPCLNLLFLLSGFRVGRLGRYLKLLTQTKGEQTEDNLSGKY